MRTRKNARICFTVYCAGMLPLLFLRELPQGQQPYIHKMLSLLNPVPFETITHFLRLLGHPDSALVRLAAVNLFGNVIMFIPLGLLLPAAFPALRSWWKTLAVAAGGIAAVELGQMLTLLGTCDVDDLILNLLGAAMGWGLFLLFRKKRKQA